MKGVAQMRSALRMARATSAAVLDESSEVARPVLADARRSIEHGLDGFEPDGGWEEGPTTIFA